MSLIEQIMDDLLGNDEVLKLEIYNSQWVLDYTIKNHTLRIKESDLEIGLKYLLKWKENGR